MKNYIKRILLESLNDLVYTDGKFLSNDEKFRKYFKGLRLSDYKNKPYPKNESDKTNKELKYLKRLKNNKDLVMSSDDIIGRFKVYFNEKNIDYPKLLVKDLISGSKNFIMKLKHFYNRPRPKQIAKKIDIDLNCSNIKSAKTPSYPSGHTAQSLLIANVLGDLYPKHKDNLLRIAEEISKSRMVAKVHFPSDVKFGKKIGISLYKQYKKNGN